MCVWGVDQWEPKREKKVGLKGGGETGARKVKRGGLGKVRAELSLML